VVARNSDYQSNITGSGEVVDGELSDVGQMGDKDLENEANGHLDENATAVASVDAPEDGMAAEGDATAGNGLEHSNGSVNGADSTGTRTVVNLPRRKPRPLGEVATADTGAPTVPIATPPFAPTPTPAPAPAAAPAQPPATARPTGVALPAKAKGGKQAVPPPPSMVPAPVARAAAGGAAAVTPAKPAEPLSTKAFRLVVTYENAIYMIIFALAIVTRFWDLGDRGIHHDESLHSVYSRNLYDGAGYTHDPMMHGPLQFNFISVMFWLFGTSDTTTRFASAICGVFVVMAPFFLRKQMGRWPALIASILFLVSPTVLYFSRMAREDSIYSGMEMLMIVGLWRFLSTRRPGDFFIFMAGLSLMFTIKETAYLTFAVMAIFFGVVFALQAGYAILAALVGYGAAMGGFYLFISSKMKSGEIPKLPDIPATSPDYNTIMGFVSNLFAHPLVQGAIAITIIFIALLAFLFISQRRKVAAEELGEVQVVPRRPQRTPGGSKVVLDRSAELPSRRVRPSARVVDDEATVPANGAVASSNGHVVEAIATSPNGKQTNGQELADAEAELAQYRRVGTVSQVQRAAARLPSLVESQEATKVWDPRRLDPKPGSFLGRYQPGSLPYLVGSLFSKPSVLLIGFIMASAIFIVLYSVFFTDVPRGILSGLFASLGYWMAQQGVARGDQPWYYYLLIMPLYEPIAVFFGLVATVFFSVKGIRALLRRRETRYESGEPGLSWFNIDRSVPFAKFSVLLPAFMIWWCAAALVLYSWAGEKMPWLTMHLARPTILLASLFLGALLSSIIARRQERLAYAEAGGLADENGQWDEVAVAPPRRAPEQAAVPQRRRPGEAAAPMPARRRAPVRTGPSEQEPPWISWNRPGSKFPAISFLVLFTLLAFAWGLKMNALTFKNDTAGWGQTWIYPILMIILIVAYAVWLGWQRALRFAAVGIFAVLFVYQFKSATALAYQHPDVPIEMATYVQTSPDVTRTLKELNDYSNYATGGTNLKVIYDSFTSWPFEWYLRDFKNKQFIGDSAPQTTGPDAPPVLLLEYAKHNNDPNLSNYVVQRYAMRWWFPEELYKQNLIPGLDYHSAPMTSQIGEALSSAVQTITDPGRMSTLWNYLEFRKLPNPLGSEDMVVALRRDIAQQWHYLQYQPPTINDLPPVTNNPPSESDTIKYNPNQ
jgi:predicted membrane-bound mannosyltransferase